MPPPRFQKKWVLHKRFLRKHSCKPYFFFLRYQHSYVLGPVRGASHPWLLYRTPGRGSAPLDRLRVGRTCRTYKGKMTRDMKHHEFFLFVCWWPSLMGTQEYDLKICMKHYESTCSRTSNVFQTGMKSPDFWPIVCQSSFAGEIDQLLWLNIINPLVWNPHFGMVWPPLNLTEFIELVCYNDSDCLPDCDDADVRNPMKKFDCPWRPARVILPVFPTNSCRAHSLYSAKIVDGVAVCLLYEFETAGIPWVGVSEN